MTFNPDDIEDDAPPTQEQYAKVAKLAQDQLDAEAAVAKAEQALKDSKKTLADISERDLPAAMKEIRCTGWKLEDGSEVELIEIIRAGIKADDPPGSNPRRDEAFKYLRDTPEEGGLGWGDLIKKTITVYFGKGEEKLAARLAKTITKNLPNQTMEQKEAVHSQTLSATVRDYLAADAEKDPEDQVPLKEDLLGVFRQTLTKIKPPKKSKKKTMI